MNNSYMEDLPEDMARIILGNDYKENVSYKLITMTEGTYISGYDSETGERISMTAEGDDLKLDIESAPLEDDAIPEYAPVEEVDSISKVYYIVCALSLLLPLMFYLLVRFILK